MNVQPFVLHQRIQFLDIVFNRGACEYKCIRRTDAFDILRDLRLPVFYTLRLIQYHYIRLHFIDQIYYDYKLAEHLEIIC